MICYQFVCVPSVIHIFLQCLVTCPYQILTQFLPLNADKFFQIVCIVPLSTPGVHKDHVFDNASKFFWGKRFALKLWDQGV